MTDQWTELERLAKAVSPKRWTVFDSHWTNTFAVKCLRTGKEVIPWTGFDASGTATTPGKRQALAHYLASLAPAAILELITAARASSVGTTGEAGREQKPVVTELVEAAHWAVKALERYDTALGLDVDEAALIALYKLKDAISQAQTGNGEGGA